MTKKSGRRSDGIEMSDEGSVRPHRPAGSAPPGISLPERPPATGATRLSAGRLRAIAAALDGPVAADRAVLAAGTEGACAGGRDGAGRARPREDRGIEERRLMGAFADIRDAAAREHLLSLAEALATLSRARPRSS